MLKRGSEAGARSRVLRAERFASYRGRPLATFVFAILAGASACAYYPKPDVQLQRTTHKGLEAGETVTILSAAQSLQQTKFAECVDRAMRESAPALNTMPGSKFRDALYPWFEPAAAPATVDELTVLLARPAVKRRVAELKVRFVVVVSGNTSGDSRGFFDCGAGYGGAGCLGVESWDRETRISAAVWDLTQGSSVGDVTAKTAGTSVAIGIGVPILFLALTESAACDGLGQRLAQFVTGMSP